MFWGICGTTFWESRRGWRTNCSHAATAPRSTSSWIEPLVLDPGVALRCWSPPQSAPSPMEWLLADWTKSKFARPDHRYRCATRLAAGRVRPAGGLGSFGKCNHGKRRGARRGERR